MSNFMADLASGENTREKLLSCLFMNLVINAFITD